MKNTVSNPRGFTLIELLVVITIIAIMAALLLPVMGRFKRSSQEAAAKQTMNSIVMALEKYREDFEVFPPDTAPSSNGSEILYFHLCRKMRPKVTTADGRVVDGEVQRGPYLEAKDTVVSSGSGDMKKLVSPLGGDYVYTQLLDTDGRKRSCLVVDPGRDKELGGDMTPDKGFVPGGGDKNQDGETDDKDNVYSTAQIQK